MHWMIFEPPTYTNDDFLRIRTVFFNTCSIFPFCLYVTYVGMIIDFKFTHPKNMNADITVTEVDRYTSFKATAEANAY
jgi:hypothetical protein